MIRSELPLAKATLQQSLIAFALVILSLFIFSPSIVGSFSTNYLGGSGGDTSIYIWLSNLFPFQVQPEHWFDTNGFFPYSNSLAFSDNWIFPSAVFYLLHQSVASDIACWNVVFILSLTFFGFFSFLLLYSLTESMVLSVLYGVLAPQLAPFEAHFGHPQMLQSWIVPLLLYLFFQWLSQKKNKVALLIGISLSISFLCSVYLTFFSGVLLVCLLLWAFIRGPFERKLQEVLQFISFAGLGLLPTIPFIIPYIKVMKAFGERGYWEPWGFQAAITSFVSFGSFNWLYYPSLKLSHSEADLGFGFIMPMLCFIAFIFTAKTGEQKKSTYFLFVSFISVCLTTIYTDTNAPVLAASHWFFILSLIIVFFQGLPKGVGLISITNNELIRILFLIALLCMIFSFGPVATPDKATYTPYFIAYHFIPGFAGFRAVSRFGLISVYLFSLIAFLWLALLQARRGWHTAPLLLCALIFVENITGQFPFEPVSEKPDALKYFDQLTATIPAGSLISLPYGDADSGSGEIKNHFAFASLQNQTLLWLVGKTISSVNGFSGIKTRLIKELPRKLKDFPDASSLDSLAEFPDVHYLLITLQFFKQSQFHSSEELLSFIAKNQLPLATLYKGADGTLLLEVRNTYKVTTNQNFTLSSKARSFSCRFSKITTSKNTCGNENPLSALLTQTNKAVKVEMTKDAVTVPLPIPEKSTPFVKVSLINQFAQCPVKLEECTATLDVTGR